MGIIKLRGFNLMKPPKKRLTDALPTIFTRQEISQRAFDLWEKDGCPTGRESEYWAIAEQEIKGRDGKSVGKGDGQQNAGPKKVSDKECK